MAGSQSTVLPGGTGGPVGSGQKKQDLGLHGSVSWNSSTSMREKCSPAAARTSGYRRRTSRQVNSRSSKSITAARRLNASYSARSPSSSDENTLTIAVAMRPISVDALRVPQQRRLRILLGLEERPDEGLVRVADQMQVVPV